MATHPNSRFFTKKSEYKDGVCNEATTVSIYFLGILIIRRKLNIIHDMSEGNNKHIKPGF